MADLIYVLFFCVFLVFCYLKIQESKARQRRYERQLAELEAEDDNDGDDVAEEDYEDYSAETTWRQYRDKSELYAGPVADQDEPEFIPWYRLKVLSMRRFLEMTEHIAELEKDNREMETRLAKCEGQYFLPQAKTWGEQYAELERKCAEAEARAFGLEMKVDYMQQLIQTYKQAMSLDAKEEIVKPRDSKGRYVDPEAPEPVKRGSSATGSAEPAAESKAVRAYRMAAKGVTRDVIAQRLGISPASVKVYINNGKKELTETCVHVTADGVNYHRVPLIEVDDRGRWVKDPECMDIDIDVSEYAM